MNDTIISDLVKESLKNSCFKLTHLDGNEPGTSFEDWITKLEELCGIVAIFKPFLVGSSKKDAEFDDEFQSPVGSRTEINYHQQVMQLIQLYSSPGYAALFRDKIASQSKVLKSWLDAETFLRTTLDRELTQSHLQLKQGNEDVMVHNIKFLKIYLKLHSKPSFKEVKTFYLNSLEPELRDRMMTTIALAVEDNVNAVLDAAVKMESLMRATKVQKVNTMSEEEDCSTIINNQKRFCCNKCKPDNHNTTKDCYKDIQCEECSREGHPTKKCRSKFQQPQVDGNQSKPRYSKKRVKCGVQCSKEVVDQVTPVSQITAHSTNHYQLWWAMSICIFICTMAWFVL